MIKVESVDAFYGDLQVLNDVSFSVDRDNGVVAVVGPNGAGKSTLLKVLSGLHSKYSGTVEILGNRVSDTKAYKLNRHGFVLVPEQRRLFHEMTVVENLKMGCYGRNTYEEKIEEIFELFPRLQERSDQLAGSMSGGEQQMLAVARGLMPEPEIIALDEPSSGLAPQLVSQLFDKIEQISIDTTVFLVEQHVNEALRIAQRGYILENGEITKEGTGDELLNDEYITQAYLGGS